jgi:hypothetical protein
MALLMSLWSMLVTSLQLLSPSSLLLELLLTSAAGGPTH